MPIVFMSADRDIQPKIVDFADDFCKCENNTTYSILAYHGGIDGRLYSIS